MCFIGDGNNMMNSLIVGCLKMKMAVSVACPEGYRPPQEILEFAAQYPCFELTDDPKKAAVGADVMITTCGPPWARKARPKRAARPLRATRSTRIS